MKSVRRLTARGLRLESSQSLQLWLLFERCWLRSGHTREILCLRALLGLHRREFCVLSDVILSHPDVGRSFLLCRGMLQFQQTSINPQTNIESGVD